MVFFPEQVRNYVEFPDQVSLVDIYICEVSEGKPKRFRRIISAINVSLPPRQSTWEADGKMVYTVISIIAQVIKMLLGSMERWRHQCATMLICSSSSCPSSLSASSTAPYT